MNPVGKEGEGEKEEKRISAAVLCERCGKLRGGRERERRKEREEKERRRRGRKEGRKEGRMRMTDGDGLNKMGTESREARAMYVPRGTGRDHEKGQ